MIRAGSIADDWANSAELRTAVQRRGGRRAALEGAIRDAIRGGGLLPLDAIPSSRALAIELGIARGTVAEAYAQLAAEGYLEARPGATTRVAAGAAGSAARIPAIEASTPGLPLSLEAGLPDVTAFPRSAWLAALRRALGSAPSSLLAPRDARGARVLREMLATHLRRTRGVVADPGRVLITCGFGHGLAILCRVFRDGGLRTIAIEDPCLHQHRALAVGAGLRVLPLPVDEGGAVVPSAAGVEVALVTPAHQFPLGMTLAPARRGALIAWARACGGTLIEDDYDGEYRYDHQPLGALQGLDPGHVVYAGTVSKTLAPGLRIGWLVLPEALVEVATAAKERAGGEASVIEQLALAELMRTGAYDRHVRRTRLRYRRRRDQLLELLAERTPWLTVRGIAAGLHVVLELPPGADEQELVARAARSGLALSGLAPFWHEPQGRPGGLIVGYAAPPEHEYAATLAAFASVLD
jgi:GntR family transcriptional regulator/MocR family aminotransferase